MCKAGAKLVMMCSVVATAAPASAGDGPPSATPPAAVPSRQAETKQHEKASSDSQDSKVVLGVLVTLGLPIAGAFAGHAKYEHDQRRCERNHEDEPEYCGEGLFSWLRSTFVGSVVGLGAAILIDVALVASSRPEPAPRLQLQTQGFVPHVVFGERSVSLGVSARF